MDRSERNLVHSERMTRPWVTLPLLGVRGRLIGAMEMLLMRYLPQAATEDVIREVVIGAIDTLTKDGARPGAKEMGTVMKVVQQRIFADGLRADGKVVSELVRAELAK